MSVDIGKITAKKSYLVALKACEICKKVLSELNIQSSNWMVDSEHAKSATFSMNMRERYAYAEVFREGKRVTEQNLAKKRAEYDNDLLHCADSAVEQTLNDIPMQLTYIVLEESVAGCIVKAICKPTLYFKIIKQIKYEDSDLQNVRIQGEEFLDHIFIGGLGAKEIAEEAEASRVELLINDVHRRQITERFYEMLRDATTCVLLMGWVGTDCLPKLKELKNTGVTIRSITHKPSESKSSVPANVQKGYAELIGIIGLNNVSVNSLLHGRACIVDNRALIGSMDFNSHSLSGEHVEFAIYTEDVDTVRALRSYFESMFKPLKEA